MRNTRKPYAKKKCGCGKPWTYNQKSFFGRNQYYCVACYKALNEPEEVEAGAMETQGITSNVSQLELL